MLPFGCLTQFVLGVEGDSTQVQVLIKANLGAYFFLIKKKPGSLVWKQVLRPWYIFVLN
jgi:uncharacterized membrane protein YwaF